MIEWIFAQVPWWAWLILVSPFVGAAFYFFGPVIMAIWAVVPRPVKWVLGGVLAFTLAFFAGRNKGIKLQKEQQKRLDERAVQKRQEIHDEVQKLDQPSLDKRLDKWMRD